MINYIKKVIDSCENHDQLDTAKDWCYNLMVAGILPEKLFEDFWDYFWGKSREGEE